MSSCTTEFSQKSAVKLFCFVLIELTVSAHPVRAVARFYQGQKLGFKITTASVKQVKAQRR